MTIREQGSVKGNNPDKAIISAALTGALTTRDQCESIPYMPEEIAADATEARENGAAIAHIHARTENGSPTYETKIYQKSTTRSATAPTSLSTSRPARCMPHLKNVSSMSGKSNPTSRRSTWGR